MDTWKPVAIVTYRDPPESTGQTLAVTVPQARVNEVESLLRRHGAMAVDDPVTIHEHPHLDRVMRR